MKKVIKIDENRLKVNPFVEALSIDVTRVVNDSQHNIVDGVLHPVCYDVERKQSARIFYDLFYKDKMSQLSSSAQRMLIYILCNLQQGQDWVYVNKDRYMQKNGLTSVNTARKGLTELWDNGFISPTAAYPNDVYWINPTIFFSGSRIAKYPTKVKVKSTVSR